jgi:DNA-binding CsgD family transcriptional regulator
MTDTRTDLALKREIRRLEKKIEQLEARLKEKTADLLATSLALREEIRRRESAETALADSDSRLRTIEDTGCRLPRKGEAEAKPPGMKEIDTMGVLVERNKRYRQELEEKILYNISRLVMPHIDNLLERALDVGPDPNRDLQGTFSDGSLSLYSGERPAECTRLTRAESRVADLLRKGHRTREIAEILKLSDKTIETHRKKIRRKLGLSHRKANLRTYLRSIQHPAVENASAFQPSYSSGRSGDFGGSHREIGEIDDKHQDHPQRQPKRP